MIRLAAIHSSVIITFCVHITTEQNVLKASDVFLLMCPVVSNCVVILSRMDSMLDSRPQTVARYDLNQTQRHVVPSWNGGNEAMMGQIRSQNIQQQQGLQFVAGNSIPTPVDISVLPGGDPGLQLPDKKD